MSALATGQFLIVDAPKRDPDMNNAMIEAPGPRRGTIRPPLIEDARKFSAKRLGLAVEMFLQIHCVVTTPGSNRVGQNEISRLAYNADYPPQLFDLSEYPEEFNDLAEDANAWPIREGLVQELFKICDPAAVHRAAKLAQAKLLQESGGRDAVIARGDLGFSVPPGVTPEFD